MPVLTRDRHADRSSSWALVLLPLVALPCRVLLIVRSLYPGPSSVFDVGFGFGDYTRNLIQSAQFRSCVTLPFQACHPGFCVFSTRMPALPMTYAALSAFVGTHAAAVAIVKCSVLALLVALFLRFATRDFRVSWLGVGAMYLLYFGLQPMKHGASLEYEEGVLVDLSLCLAIAVIYLTSSARVIDTKRRAIMAAAAVALATYMYFAKTTALLTLLVILAMTATRRTLSWRLKALLILLACVPFSLWLAHNALDSGRWSASSSWNGENMLRGYNSGAAAIYPEITLDRAFDSTRAVLRSGVVVPLGNFSGNRCFDDEWSWNDYYASRAKEWLLSHPAEALRFDLKKAWVALVEIRHTPMFLSATDKTAEYPAATNVAMIAWMIYARLLFFTLFALLLRDILHGQRNLIWVCILVAAACGPYILVFGWQRHMVPVLIMTGTLLVFLYLARERGDARAL